MGENPVAVWRVNFIERTRVARKLSGMKSKAMAAALGVSVTEYRLYESSLMLPASLLDAFCVLTRVSRDYMLEGRRREPGKQPPQIAKHQAIAAPRNLCGAPCPYGTKWCTTLRCI